MKTKSAEAPLHQNSDPPLLCEQLTRLKARGCIVARPATYHIKVGPFNWYWNSGKIVIDPCLVHLSKGFDALMALIDKTGREDGFKSCG